MAYATVSDYESRHPADGQTPTWYEDVVSTLLDDAAVFLESYVSVDVSDQHQAALLRIISCDMVQRAMKAVESSLYGVDQATATVGPFSQSVHYATALGGLFVTPTERRLLGASGSYIGSIPAGIGGYYGSNT